MKKFYLSNYFTVDYTPKLLSLYFVKCTELMHLISASDSFSQFLALYKFVCMYVSKMYYCFSQR